MIYACHTACAVWRGGRHQLPPTFPRSPGIIPVVLSPAYFRPPRFDCSIKERDERVAKVPEVKDLFLTTSSPIRLVNNLGIIWLTGY